MRALITIWLLACSLCLSAMQLVPFTDQDQKIKVYRMDSVLILADTAYVISRDRAQLLNHKLAELKRAYATNAHWVDVNAELLEKVLEIERLVFQLMQHIREDQDLVAMDFADLLQELERHIAQLQITNTALDEQNAVLQNQLDEMEQTIQHLKRTIRKQWWRNALEKILIGLAGFGVGWLVGR